MCIRDRLSAEACEARGTKRDPGAPGAATNPSPPPPSGETARGAPQGIHGTEAGEQGQRSVAQAHGRSSPRRPRIRSREV
eukprot:5568552-Pyramimonas_sp.AAC.1